MKAYITNSNAKRIIYKIDIEGIDLNDEIYEIDFKWFSKNEKMSLLSFKLLFEDPEEFFKKYIKRKITDKKEFVFEGQPPSHHKAPNCERLSANFLNYKIPDEIKNKGDEAIDDFRTWFKEHMYLIENKMDLFLDKMKWKFGLKERPKVVDYKNSGTERIENLDLETLQIKIETLICDTETFRTANPRNRIIIENFGKNSFIWKEEKPPYNNKTIYSNEEIWQVLKQLDNNYKIPIANLLREYYKVKFNPELKFEGRLLEQLGFQPCRQCYGFEYLSQFDEREISLGPVDIDDMPLASDYKRKNGGYKSNSSRSSFDENPDAQEWYQEEQERLEELYEELLEFYGDSGGAEESDSRYDKIPVYNNWEHDTKFYIPENLENSEPDFDDRVISKGGAMKQPVLNVGETNHLSVRKKKKKEYLERFSKLSSINKLRTMLRDRKPYTYYPTDVLVGIDEVKNQLTNNELLSFQEMLKKKY